MRAFHPCSNANYDIKQEIKECCELLDGSFKDIAAHEIMMIMKYSLEVSDPMILKYSGRDHKQTKSFHLERNLLQLWLDKIDDKLKHLGSYLQGWR